MVFLKRKEIEEDRDILNVVIYLIINDLYSTLLKQTLSTPGLRDPTETETELCLNVSCRGTGQQWTAAGAGALGAIDLRMDKPSWRRLPLTPPQNHQNLHRTGEKDSWRTQAKICVHQYPGERSSEKVGLKLNIQKTKIMASDPIISW